MIDLISSHPALLVTIVVVLAVSVPAAIGVYAWLVTVRRRREEELTYSIAGVDELTGTEFERFVAALMRRTGFVDVQVCGGAGDLGADITALVPEGRIVVQCKRHRSPVGSSDVQKLGGTAQALHDAAVAAIVTTSRFTKPAVEISAPLGIALVDRDALAAWAADGRPPQALLRRARRGAGWAPGTIRPVPG